MDRASFGVRSFGDRYLIGGFLTGLFFDKTDRAAVNRTAREAPVEDHFDALFLRA